MPQIEADQAIEAATAGWEERPFNYNLYEELKRPEYGTTIVFESDDSGIAIFRFSDDSHALVGMGGHSALATWLPTDQTPRNGV